MRRLLYIAFLLLPVLTVFGQDPEPKDTVSMEQLNKQIDSLQKSLKEQLGEVFDIRAFVNSIQVRGSAKGSEIKKLLQSDAPVELSTYTKLYIDEFWPNVLTGKWKYTSDGKKDTVESTGLFSVDIRIRFDTLPNHKFTVSYELIPVPTLSLLVGEQNIDQTIDTLNKIVDALLIDEYEKVNDVPIAAIIRAINNYFDLIIGQKVNSVFNYSMLGDRLIEFKKREQSPYPFDIFQPEKDGARNSEFDKIVYGSYEYIVPWKIEINGESDTVGVSFYKKNGISFDQIKFISSKGSLFDVIAGDSENEYKLIIPDRNLSEESRIHAIVIKDSSLYSLAVLNVVPYQKETKKVSLIVVNSNKTPLTQEEIEKKLNELYKSVGVEWEVSIHSGNLKKDYQSIEVSKSLLSGYSSDMKELIQAFKDAENTVDNSTQYLFLVDKGPNDVIGYMPRGKQFGLLFTDKFNDNDLPSKLGHELGHGAFDLAHTFDLYEQGSTNYLMDSPEGDEFYKSQWDQIHDPRFRSKIFDSKEDGQLVVVSSIQDLAKFKNEDGSFTFMSMGGKPITLSGNIQELYFISAEDRWSKSGDLTPIGTLAGFKIDDKIYTGRKNKEGDFFKGYFHTEKFWVNEDELETTKEPYVDELTEKNIDEYKNILGGIMCLRNQDVVFNIFPITYFDYFPAEKDVKIENKGEGIQKEHLFFTNYFNSDQSYEVAAKLPKLEGVEQQYFLGKYANAEVCGAEAVYAFKIADMINKHKEYLVCLDDANQGVVDVAVDNAQQDALSYIQEEMATTPQADYTSFPVYPQNQPEKEDPEYDRVVEEAYNWVFEDRYMSNYYEILQRYISLIDPKQRSYSSFNDQDLSEIIDFINIQEYGARNCLFESMELGVRKSILKRADEVVGSLSRLKERTLVEILSTTPAIEYEEMLQFLEANNYTVLTSLIYDFHNSQFDEFIDIVSSMVLTVRPNTTVGPWPVVETTFSVPKPSTPNQSEKTKFLEIHKSQTFMSRGYGYSDDIRYKWNSISRYNDPSIRISSWIDEWNLDKGTEKTLGRHYYEGSPFEYIRVRFTRDFQFPNIKDGKKIKEGTEEVVPMLWAYWLLHRQEEIEDWKTLRVFINVVAGVISVATMEPGPLLLAELLFNAADIVVAINEDRIASSGSPVEQRMLANYNLLAGFIGTGIITRGAVKGIVKMSFKRDAFVGKLRQIRNVPEKLKEYKDHLVNVLNSTKAISSSAQGYNYVKSFFQAALLEAKLAKFARNIDNVTFSVAQADKLILTVQSGRQVTMAFAHGTDDVEAFWLSNINWHTGDVTDEFKIVGRFDDIPYASAGKVEADKVDDLVIVTKNDEYFFIKASQLPKTTKVTLKLSDDAIDLTDDVAGSLRKLEDNAGKGYLDVAVHGSGDKFVIDGIEHTTGDLAQIIKSNNPDNLPIRLLSCSEIGSAQDLAKNLNTKIIANDGITRIHADGSISAVSKTDGGNIQWKEIDGDGNIKGDIEITANSNYLDDFVQLGKIEETIIKNGRTFVVKRFGKNSTEVLIEKSGDDLIYYFKDDDKPFASFLFDGETMEPGIKIPDELKGQGIGSSAFHDAIKRLGGFDNVEDIQSSWNSIGELADNYKSFMKAFKKSKNAEAAAFETATGKWAKDAGYTKVLIRNDITEETIIVSPIFVKP